MSFVPNFAGDVKQAIQNFLGQFGYRIQRLPQRRLPIERPVGSMTCFLEDIARRGFKPNGILDVGANRGDWSRIAAKIFPEASFVLIEPQIEMRVHLESFCQEYRNSRWIEAGAAAVNSDATLTIWEDFQGSSFLPIGDTPLAKDKIRRNVQMVTIDSLYPYPSPAPDMVKLDIQGFELEALKGAAALFGQTELFILETSLYEFLPKCPILAEVINYMDQKAYDFYDIPGFVRRPLDGALGQVDIAFARRAGFLRQSSNWEQ